jgi:hypothetical protein
MDLIMKALTTLGGLVRTRYSIDKNDKSGIKEAIANVLKDVALPLGITIGKIFDK